MTGRGDCLPFERPMGYREPSVALGLIARTSRIPGDLAERYGYVNPPSPHRMFCKFVRSLAPCRLRCLGSLCRPSVKQNGLSNSANNDSRRSRDTSTRPCAS